MIVINEQSSRWDTTANSTLPALTGVDGLVLRRRESVHSQFAAARRIDCAIRLILYRDSHARFASCVQPISTDGASVETASWLSDVADAACLFDDFYRSEFTFVAPCLTVRCFTG